MNTIIAPGMWIVPIPPLPKYGEEIGCHLENMPYFCVEIGLICDKWPAWSPGVCDLCNNADLYLQIRERPGFAFCPNHWRPVLLPKAELFRTLLAPIPQREDAVIYGIDWGVSA